MSRINPKNERVKRRYLHWEARARGKSPKTINKIRKALVLYEEHIGYKDFGELNSDVVVEFKEKLASQISKRTDNPLTLSYQREILGSLRSFFAWLKQESGYKKQINMNDISYFSLSIKEQRASKAPRSKNYPKSDQVIAVIKKMPVDSEIQQRDRAILTMLLLTGIRVDALRTLKIKHVDLKKLKVFQNPNDVSTKFSKYIEANFIVFDEVLVGIIKDWIDWLQNKSGFSPDDTLFPKTALGQSIDNELVPVGLDKKGWSTTSPIREIVKKAFEGAGFGYYNPHSFRDTHAHLIYDHGLSIEETNALSMNLGHDHVSTTLGSYGNIEPERRAQVLQSLSAKIQSHKKEVGSNTSQDLSPEEIVEKIKEIFIKGEV